ncbi:MAG: hypothetical protein AAFN74_08465 [Myxococcota bacterium]
MTISLSDKIFNNGIKTVEQMYKSVEELANDPATFDTSNPNMAKNVAKLGRTLDTIGLIMRVLMKIDESVNENAKRAMQGN